MEQGQAQPKMKVLKEHEKAAHEWTAITIIAMCKPTLLSNSCQTTGDASAIVLLPVACDT